MTILIGILQVFPNIVSSEETASIGRLFVGLILILVLFVAIGAAIWATMFWVTRAHRAVCSIRGITSRIPSNLLGFLSGVPYILFFIPLCYALDFLVVRSESSDTPTMRWYSSFSKSLIVNVFAIVIIVDSAITIYDMLKEFLVKQPSTSSPDALDWVGTILFTITVILGIRIAKMVNHNIEALVHT
jgi:hypothetical protein